MSETPIDPNRADTAAHEADLTPVLSDAQRAWLDAHAGLSAYTDRRAAEGVSS